ncbi:MAG: YihA family ribosome biogenesis GTP-binding protein [Oscillospiraceae bacterium]|nr:YihA family ribosome biogenesis GTP-binding protein [Oscillospiraceae bacterium]
MNYNNATFSAAYGLFEQIPPSDQPEFAFSGRSNVGKSSLINKLLMRKGLARTSATPGKTVTINFFDVDKTIIFADLPGYGYAKVSKSEKQRWAGLIEGYFGSDRNLALVFQLIDMRHAPSKDDQQMLSFLIENEYPFVVVLTKADKLSKKQQQERLAAFRREIPFGEEITMIPFSAETGLGVDVLREIIEDVISDEE